MKILHILNTDRYSGAENVVCQIINALRVDSEIECIYCSIDGEIRGIVSEKDISFEGMSEMSVSEIKRVIKKVKPDVIHAHDMRASLFAAIACGKTPLISHIHNNAFDARGISIKSFAYVVAAIKAKHIFWVSDSAYKGYVFRNIVKKKSSVLKNIIDINEIYKKRELDNNEYSYDVVFLGRLSYEKNPMRIIDIFEKVLMSKPNAKLAFIGKGELEKELKEMCEQKNITNKVDFLGFRSNPIKILSDSKVMIMTSLWEGLPMCALEAMAVGTPIVSTPTDGLREIIQQNVNGYISNDDAELADKIIELISSDDKYKIISNNAIEISKKINNVELYRESIVLQYRK